MLSTRRLSQDPSEQPQPLLRGWLVKRSGSTKDRNSHAWNERYFILYASSIQWYKKEFPEGGKPPKRRGLLHMNEGVQLIPDADPFTSKPWTFGLRTVNGCLWLQVSSEG